MLPQVTTRVTIVLSKPTHAFNALRQQLNAAVVTRVVMPSLFVSPVVFNHFLYVA